jgi:hypothetical protein
MVDPDRKTLRSSDTVLAYSVVLYNYKIGFVTRTSEIINNNTEIIGLINISY